MKTLILSCNTGGGHNTAGRALLEELNRRDLPAEMLDALSFGRKHTSRIVSQSYINVASVTPKLFGGIYGGVSLTAVFYFLVIKGAKGASFMQPEWISWIGANTTELLLGCFAILTVLFQALIMALRINIFPIIILAGTFSLAFAFAGNDLVNFIGVPLAALSSYEIWSAVEGADPTTFMMEGLRHNQGTPTYFLLASGLVMVLTLWFSKKAHRVIRTSISLASSARGGKEQFGSSLPARIVASTTSPIRSFRPPSSRA